MKFFGCVVRFDRLGDDGAGGVAVLEILRLRGDSACDVTGREA